jgi:Na+/melibiose symporter-like transporter
MKKIRQIFAIFGIILLAGMYILTLALAITNSSDTDAFLMASIFCTVAVPVLLYAMTVTARVLKNRGDDPGENSSEN